MAPKNKNALPLGVASPPSPRTRYEIGPFTPLTSQHRASFAGNPGIRIVPDYSTRVMVQLQVSNVHSTDCRTYTHVSNTTIVRNGNLPFLRGPKNYSSELPTSNFACELHVVVIYKYGLRGPFFSDIVEIESRTISCNYCNFDRVLKALIISMN